MKAADLIKNKGIQYAIEIVENAPEGVLAWNEGYEFTCGQAINISDEDQEKYFVDMGELKRLVGSWEIIESFNGVKMAQRFIGENVECSDSERLKQAIADVESIGGLA